MHFMIETASERLRAVREERYETAADASTAMHIKYATYAGHENGSRGLTKDAAVRYAAFFKINVEWLLYGTGPKRGSKHPVVAMYERIPEDKRSQAIDYLEYLGGQGPKPAS